MIAGAAKGAVEFWLESQITQIPSSKFKNTLHKTDLSAGALVETLGETAIWSLVGVGDFVSALSTLQSLAIPEASWNSDSFSMVSYVYLEEGQTYRWLFQVNSSTACAAIGIASNVTTLDVDVNLEEVNITLVNAQENDPLLYNARVEPPSGTTIIEYEYLVDYSDIDGDPPEYIKVYVDGVPHHLGLTPISGSPANGTYHLPGVILSAGTHHYWFEAKDIRGGYAETDFSEGPVVGSGSGSDLSIYSLNWDDDNPSDGDGIPEAGEGVDLGVCLENISSQELTGVIATLTCNIGNVDITDDTVQYWTIAPYGKSWGVDEFDMFLDFSSTWHDLPFELDITYMKDSVEYQQVIPFTKTFYEDGQLQPIFAVDHIDIVTDESSGGDNDGVPESGENLEFDIYLKNIGNADATDVEAHISNVSIGNTYEGWENYPNLTAGGPAQKQSTSNFNLWDIPKDYTGSVTADIIVRCDGNPDQLIANYPLFIIMPTAWLWVNPDEWDFGVSPTTEDVIKTVTIHNQDTEEMAVTGITPSHPADTSWNGEPLPWTILADGSKTIEVVIETSSLSGLISREVVINVSADVHVSNDRIAVTGLVSDAVPSYQLPSTTYTTGSYDLDVGENIIVWADDRNGNNDIYAYVLTTMTEIPICTNPKPQGNPRISGDIIVWKDWRNDDGSWSNADIYGYDLSTGQEIIVSSNPANERLIGTDANMIAFGRVYYEFTEPSNWDEAWNLHVYEYQGDGQFAEICTTGFTPTPGHEPKQSIYPDGDFGGGLLVFERHEIYWRSEYSYWSSQDQHLEKIDFSLSETSPSRVSCPNHWSWQYAADAHKFTYVKYDGDDDQIWIWDNGSCRQLTNEPVDHAFDLNLAIGCGIAVYDKRGQSRLFGLDLETSNEFLIAEMQVEPARMDGCLLVWGKRSTSELYYCFLNQAEISVLSTDIVLSNPEPYEGDTIDVDVTVHNVNPWDTTENIIVRLYDGDPDTNGTQLGTDQIISGGITGRDEATVTFNDISVGVEGTKLIYAKLFISFSDNPMNNKASKELVVQDTDIQGPIIFNVVVTEYNGDGDGVIEDNEQLWISWQATDTSGLNSSYCQIESVNYLASGTYYVVVGPYAAGSYNYTIYATDDDISPETSEFSGVFYVAVASGPCDLNNSGKVDMNDYALLASRWLDSPCSMGNSWCNGADINHDIEVNTLDLFICCDNWLR